LLFGVVLCCWLLFVMVCGMLLEFVGVIVVIGCWFLSSLCWLFVMFAFCVRGCAIVVVCVYSHWLLFEMLLFCAVCLFDMLCLLLGLCLLSCCARVVCVWCLCVVVLCVCVCVCVC
jgi:hypothetical protein